MRDDTHVSTDTGVSAENRNDSPGWPVLVAFGVGILLALFSFSPGHSISLFFGDAGIIISGVVFPGVLGAIAIDGNAHAFSLWIAAGINFIFYFIFVWTICTISRRIPRRFR